MSTNGAWIWVKRWWFVAVALFGLGWNAADLRGDVDDKADKEDVTEMKRDIKEIKAVVSAIESRQREVYCADKPVGCR